MSLGPNTVLAVALALVASTTPSAGVESETAQRIARAFQEHGMDDAQSRCYGTVIAGDSGIDREAAAAIVEEAENADEIEAGVKEAGIEMAMAFLSAKEECGG